MKINILMPTYNDEKTILEALNSVKEQTYDNWSLTIINDGSTDNTEDVVKNWIENNSLKEKVTYIYQENKDQLNAIKNGLSHIKNNDGLVYILHSDDMFASPDVLRRADEFYEKSDPDAIISDVLIMDESSNITGRQKVKAYKKSEHTVALLALWLGRNLYLDMAFWKMDVFKKQVANNYLTWNTPFWLSCDDASMLDVQNVDFPFFKYRVFSENYINNEIGTLNVLNGELRCELNILKLVNIPFYKLQYFLFRSLNKFGLPYRVIYSHQEHKNIYETIKFVIGKRLDLGNISKYPYYNSILNFFKNFDNDNTIELINIKSHDVFYGSDVRTFNKKMLEGKLPNLYYELFDLMNSGFKTVITDKENYENVKAILRFMDIDKYVEIKTK